MPNPKKPSERIFEMQQTDKDVFTYNVSYAIKTMAAILDEQAEQIQSLRKEVEELKKIPHKTLNIKELPFHFHGGGHGRDKTKCYDNPCSRF